MTPSAFELEALQRAPLAEATLRLLNHALDADLLATVFAEHGYPAMEKELTFPLFVTLMRDALIEYEGSGRQAFTHASDDDRLPVTPRAVYGKLDRLPLPIGPALLADATSRLQTLWPTGVQTPLPASLAAFRVIAFDGKKLKHVARRLKCLRGLRGQLVAAKILAAIDLRTGLALGMEADPDGEAGDGPLLPFLLTTLRARVPGPRLWVGDRLCCDLTRPRQLGAAGDHFLVRYNAKVKFYPDPTRPVQTGTDARGRTYTEEWGWLGGPTDPRRLEVRRLTLSRPKAEAVILVTDLLDAQRYPAVDLLDTYLRRWGIEEVFQQITEVFQLRPLIGSTPQAGVFQAAFCMVLYNVVITIRGYLAGAQQRDPETISTENVFVDVERQTIGLHEMVGVAELVELLAQTRPVDLAAHLRILLAAEWGERWLKAPTRVPAEQGPATQPGKPTRYIPGGHTSVYRLQHGITKPTKTKKKRPRRKKEASGRN